MGNHAAFGLKLRRAKPGRKRSRANIKPHNIGGDGLKGFGVIAMESAVQNAIQRPKERQAGMARILQFTLNGRARTDAVRDNLLLLDYLREVVGLTGTKTGCDGGECGACTVLVDDTPRLSCLTLAASVEGRRIDTIESLGTDGHLSAVQRGFHEKLGSQCGYCTPGYIMASAGLLRRNANPTDAEIREALGSNICRCTGYVKIIEAVKHAASLCAAGLTP
jgi:4-hydroxybenzoyl-CoA reductase subunit gamma